MRPLEWVVVVGAAMLLWGWAAGWRVGRLVSAGLGALLVGHLFLEGQRMMMWPVYLIIGVAGLVSLGGERPRRPPGGRWRALGRWTIALTLLTLFVPLPWLWPVMRLPKPAGPFSVGTSWLTVTDSTRRERFGPAAAVRAFPVKVWYPAAPGTSGTLAPYSAAEEPTFGAIPAAMFRQLALVKTHSLLSVPIAPDPARFPVIIFSHGYGGYPAQNTPQMEELASQGYVVLSIGHPGEAGAVSFPDGRLVMMDSALLAVLKQSASGPGASKALAAMSRADSARTAPDRRDAWRAIIAATPEPLRSLSLVEWAADTKALVDRLEQMNRDGAGALFAGRLDLERLGIAGMSYGGATAGEFCRVDRRCKAGFNLDGGQYGGLIDDSLTVPFFILASEQAYAVHRPVLDVLKGPAFLVRVPKTNHLGLTDMALMAPVLYRWSGVTGRLDPSRREAIMTRYLVGFFDSYLKGQHSPWLDGPPSSEPDLSFETGKPQ